MGVGVGANCVCLHACEILRIIYGCRDVFVQMWEYVLGKSIMPFQHYSEECAVPLMQSLIMVLTT